MAALLTKSTIPIAKLERLATGGHLWAVVDACDEPGVPPKCAELGERAVSLYRGRAAVEYAKIAPYLLLLDPPALAWILSELWTRPWGIFVHSQAGQKQIRTHLRRFLKVRAPDRSVYFFRYYDPAILMAFLESSNADELNRFFGPVHSFGFGYGSEVMFLAKATGVN